MERNGATVSAAQLVTVSHAANRLGVSRQRIHQMMDEGKIDWCRLGKYRMIQAKDVERLFRQRKANKVA